MPDELLQTPAPTAGARLFPRGEVGGPTSLRSRCVALGEARAGVRPTRDPTASGDDTGSPEA